MPNEQFVSMIVIVLTSVISLGVVIALIIVNRGRNKFTEITLDESRRLPHHRCPKCGFNMTPGFIFTQRGLFWRKPETKPMTMLMTRGKLMNNTYNMGFTAAENRAWKCDRCELVLMDVSEMVRIRK